MQFQRWGTRAKLRLVVGILGATEPWRQSIKLGICCKFASHVGVRSKTDSGARSEHKVAARDYYCAISLRNNIIRVDTNSCYANAALIQDWNVLYSLIRFRFLSLNRHVRLNFRLSFRFCPPSILNTVIRFLTASIQPCGVSRALSQAAGAWYCRFPSNSSLQNYKQWVLWSITKRLVMHRGVTGELWTYAWVGPLARLLISEAQLERVLM